MMHRSLDHGRRPPPGSARRCRAAMPLAVVLLAFAAPAAAQQTVSDVLSFLLTNRTILTDDFDRDEEAAAMTGSTIASFVVLELATLPVASSSGGFTYRLDPALGLDVRASDSFGPFFTERTLTSGSGHAAIGISYRSARYDRLGGRNLRDGTLVSTASRLDGESEPFDVETVTLLIRTDTMTVTGSVGVTDRLDLSAAVPVVRVSLEGERVDTYRGSVFTQASGAARASGIGDAVVRARYNLLRGRASGLALGVEAHLPTGDEENLLGSGRASIAPRVMASYEGARVGLHGDVSYSLRGIARTLGYGGAVTVAATSRLTMVGEVVGRRLDGVGRLVSTTLPHPRLEGVSTIRLTATPETTQSVMAVGGLKWNIASSWLLTANVVRPLTSAGLNADWVPTIAFDYEFGE